MTEAISAIFGDFVAGMRDRELAPATRHHAKRCLLDWFASVYAGAAIPPATLLAAALETDATGDARLIGSGGRACARDAALINGTAAHAAEVDDIFRDGFNHPGAPVIAGALALAEVKGLSGDALLRGIIAGYEVENHTAIAMGAAHYRYWHATGTMGFIGAAAAGASLLGLDSLHASYALGHAASFAAGLQQAFRGSSMTKPLHSGRAAEGGVLAALAAGAGITAAEDMFEGATGLGAAMSKDADWAAVMPGLGDEFTIERMTQKNHAACGHAFAGIDAAMDLKAAHEIDPARIEAIEVATYGKGVELCSNPRPTSVFEAKFSLPYCVAHGLIWGRLGMASFDEPFFSDPALHRLMARVSVRVDPEAESLAPRQRMAEVTITTDDGKRFMHRRPTRKGDPDDPLSDAELSAKFRDLVVPLIGREQATLIEDGVWSVDALANCRALSLPSW